MVKGLYTAYTGMVNSQKRLDVVSNNLANATTTGYKKEGLTTKSFDEMMGIKIKDLTVGHLNQPIGNLSLGAKIGESYRDWSQGSFISTENTYDFALSGKGFFNISFTSKSGETSTMYSRDGAFQMNVDGYLVTKDGDYVLGENGPIQLPTNIDKLEVQPTGEIYADGQYVDTFLLTDFEDYNYLEAYGENLYRTVEGATEAVAVVPEIETRVSISCDKKDAIGYIREGYAFSPMFTLGYTTKLKDKEVFATWLNLAKAN